METERFERGYLEMQVKHNEEKLAKYDVDHKKAMAEINDLKKHITALMEEIATPNKSNVDPMVKRLRKNLDEKEDELAKYIQNVSELADSNALLSDKIQYAEKQIQMLTVKTFDLQDDMEKLSAQLVDRENVIKFMEETNKQQQELIKELRRPARSEDGRSEESRFNESSYEVLDSTSTSNNTSEPHQYQRFFREYFLNTIFLVVRNRFRVSIGREFGTSRCRRSFARPAETECGTYRNCRPTHKRIGQSTTSHQRFVFRTLATGSAFRRSRRLVGGETSFARNTSQKQ